MTSATRPNMGAYDSPVILRSSPLWARLVVWAIVGITTASVLWACLAKIEEAIPAQGKLEPRGAVQPVQAPVGGVVATVEVTEGETVEAGQVLITLNPSDTEAQLQSRQDVQSRLISENQYYRAQLSGEGGAVPVTLSAEMTRLTSNRATLLEENALYQRVLADQGPGGLTSQQRQRLEAAQGGRSAQGNIDQLQVGQLTQQLEQVQEQLSSARNDLSVQQNILERIRPAVEEGAIAELQLLQQEQEVNNRQTQVASLQEEEDRILLAISQAQQQQVQNVAGADEGLLDRIAANETQIATIDSQLTRIILDNENQLDQLQAEIEQLEYALENQELRAPEAGQVFNLQVSPGYVANASEPILEIVPDDTLVARVFITNRDIGFVKQRWDDREAEPVMVDVRIDSFPFSEFGDIDGEIIRIGSDALPPDESNPFFRFPAEIEMESQMLSEALTLQSGMAVTANIKLRKRRVITILTDLFVRKLDSLKAGG
ncbi:MAG: HlyD family efflux transporter periplasmic adaptor subunit [Leptolyngbyaceae cyanobacterium]